MYQVFRSTQSLSRNIVRIPSAQVAAVTATSTISCTSTFVPSQAQLTVTLTPQAAHQLSQIRWQTTARKMFDKILIANRGEIACRVMKTCKKMGIKTVAVYSEADAHSKFVQLADEAVLVGPPRSALSYLNMENILKACLTTGAQAVHPGYGFLSENKTFCEMLEKHNISFIGPKVDAMTAMGTKIESKKIAKNAKVNIIPGYLGPINDADHAVQIAREIGYPVMVKASSGGGGKGMRIAWNDQEAREGFRFSREEAKSSFASDVILVEKFIEEPRHIEIQVLCDGYGNGVYLNERECSIQRRNQKVIEEAPSTFLDPETRKKMGEQALSLAKAVNYQSAGTVEFLVDKHRQFYFLEMNTRLQVEHPITEYITGVDLVEHMIRVAAGEKLAFSQKDIGIKGWALEARVYAEDPMRNFLPSIGRLTRYEEPDLDGGKVRCESGILEGSEISIYYDPLICKLVTYGADRNEALTRLRKSLDTYIIRGVTHNISFLRTVCDNPRFISGQISTKFIPEEFPDGFKAPTLNTADHEALVSAAVLLHSKHLDRSASIDGKVASFDAAANKKQRLSDLVVTIEKKRYAISTQEHSQTEQNETLKLNLSTVDNKASTKSVTISAPYKYGETRYTVNYNGETVHLQFVAQKPYTYVIQYKGSSYPVQVCTPRESELLALMPIETSHASDKRVLSPMPGAIVSVAVQKGDKIIVGQELCVIEAMKMQNAIRSERDAVVKAVHIQKGVTVAADQLIVEFE